MTGPACGDLRSPAGFLALQTLPNVGPATALQVTLHAGRLESLLERHAARLDQALERAQASLREYETAEIELVSFFDEHYPRRLRDLRDPPPLLYVRGNKSLLAEEKLVAVVGTREPTDCGRVAAESMTTALAGGGWGIVSGLAKGIDTIAHQVALEQGAPTIAVMGGGLDRVYPAQNQALAARIVGSGGALISEQPLGEPARPHNLIARDRLQSALSVAVLVAQTGLRGGTMHTARFAAMQGRPLFCPTAPDASRASEGLRVLLERPGRELCSVLPAWRDARKLCARLADRPLAHAVDREDLPAFLHAIELARRWPQLTADRQTLISPVGLD